MAPAKEESTFARLTTSLTKPCSALALMGSVRWIVVWPSGARGGTVGKERAVLDWYEKWCNECLNEVGLWAKMAYLG